MLLQEEIVARLLDFMSKPTAAKGKKDLAAKAEKEAEKRKRKRERNAKAKAKKAKASSPKVRHCHQCQASLSSM